MAASVSTTSSNSSTAGYQRRMFMKSYHINKGAGLAGLTIREHDIPAPGPREVLVRVRASSLSFRELLILILGYYPDRKSTRLNSSHQIISYAVFCLKKKKERLTNDGEP